MLQEAKRIEDWSLHGVRKWFLDESSGFYFIVKMLKGKRYLDPDEMRRNFIGQAGLTGLTRSFLGVPDARQERSNRLSAMEERAFTSCAARE